MPLYRATHSTTKEVVEYDEAVPRQEHLLPPWTVERVETTSAAPNAPEPEPQPVYGGRRILTQLEFLRLFTQAERVTIRVFAQGDSAYQLAVRDFMYLMELAQDVNLDDPETQEGVPQLEALGLIAPGRAEEVLRG